MKKIFTLFAAVLVGLCAFADNDPAWGPCPATMYFSLLDASNPAQVAVELQLTNSSLNLNGFNMNVYKADGSESIQWLKVSRKYLHCAGYANVILARLADATDDDREDALNEMCDIKSSTKDVDGKDVLVLIEVLSTNDCRFFPVLEEPTGIGKFFMDMSGCADGTYKIYAPQTAQGLSFSFTGGTEPTDNWITDAPVELELQKEGDNIEVTAISTVAVDQPVDNRIFDLQGRELQSVPEHGIYIQNGKKYVK